VRERRKSTTLCIVDSIIRQTTSEPLLRKRNLLLAAVPILGTLATTLLAYSHSAIVVGLFEQRMQRDIAELSDALAKAGLPQPQTAAVVAALNQVDHNVLGYVSSETTALISAIATVGIIVTAAVMALAARTSDVPPNQRIGGE
jgi:predicted PurR-regulated permease PerM